MKKPAIVLSLAAVLTISFTVTEIGTQIGILLKNGQKVTQTTSSWVNTLIADKKFIKAGEAGRQKMVDAFNEKARNVKIKGFGGTPYALTMVDFKEEGDKKSIAFQMGPYKFPMVCKNDTLLLFRNVGIMKMEVDVPVNANNPTAYSKNRDEIEMTKKTIGFGTQGVAIFPNQLKVGDKLPMYEDIYISVPTSWDDKVRHNVLAGYKRVVTTERGYVMGIDSRDGKFKAGQGTKTTTQMQAVYKTVLTDAEVSISSSIYIMHHLFATATGTEEIKIGKKTYKAFVIESQRWTKNNAVTDWKSEDEQLNANMAKWESDFKERIAKKFAKKGITNELGYGVEHVTEWFVPGVGVVNFESYDSHGVLTSNMTIDNIK